MFFLFFRSSIPPSFSQFVSLTFLISFIFSFIIDYLILLFPFYLLPSFFLSFSSAFLPVHLLTYRKVWGICRSLNSLFNWLACSALLSSILVTLRGWGILIRTGHVQDDHHQNGTDDSHAPDNDGSNPARVESGC